MGSKVLEVHVGVGMDMNEGAAVWQLSSNVGDKGGVAILGRGR